MKVPICHHLVLLPLTNPCVPPSPLFATGTFGVWDGSQMSFAESGWGLWDKLRMLWRYGSDLMSLAAATKACVAGFNTAYDIQDSGKAFTHAEDMWSALGLRDLASMTLSEYVDREGICSSGSKVMAEIAGGVSRDNYCQNPSELNALAGLIGLAPLAAGGDAVWTTEQGNVKMVQHALDAAGAKVHKCRLVTNVHDAGGRAARERFTVRSVASGGAEVDESHGYTPPRDSHTEPCGGDGGDAREDAGYDAVVIAAPLHYASVELSGSTEGYRVSATDADRSEADVGTGQFHTVHTTIVHGRRNAESMGHDDASVPGEVLTMNAPGLPFWALGSQGPHPTESDAHAEIVKVFSAGELTDEDLVSTGLFKQVHESTRVVWRAYPRFAPPEPFESFEPAPGVFCATPLERGGSAMEIAAVGGRNAAMLVANRIGSDAIAAAIHVESRGATDAANDGGAEL